MYVAIRVAVMAAISLGFYLAWPEAYHSIGTTFAIGLLVSGCGQAADATLRWCHARQAQRIGIGIAGVFIAAGAVVLVVAPHRQSIGPIEYRYVDEVMTEPTAWVGQEIKLHGFVELGTMTMRIEHGEVHHRFAVGRGGQRVMVEYIGPVPDTLKERTEVVAQGRLAHETDGAYLFTATEVMVKCPSRYQSGPVPTSKFR